MSTGPLRSRLFLASLLGRLPVGAVGLLLILRTREITGSYAAGGLVAGANALALGLVSPFVGRLIDRRGQTIVLLAGGLVFSTAMGGFALLADGAPLGAAIGLSALAGASQPPLGAALRSIWTRDLQDAAERHSAFTIESTVFELVYILGPLLFVSAVGAWSLRGAVALTGLVTVVGTAAFAAAPPSRTWRPEQRDGRDLLGALRGPGVRVLLGVFLLFGVTVAAIEMGVVVFTESRGERGALGPILGVWGLGSMLGGLVAARAGVPRNPARRMALLFAGLAVASLPLMLASTSLALGALILASGFCIAPALSLAFATVGQVAPAGTVTEAYTWSTTGIGAGVAGGAALAGWVVELGGPEDAFLLGAAAGLAASALVAFSSFAPTLSAARTTNTDAMSAFVVRDESAPARTTKT